MRLTFPLIFRTPGSIKDFQRRQCSRRVAKCGRTLRSWHVVSLAGHGLIRLLLVLPWTLFSFPMAAVSAEPVPNVDFSRDIKPIISNACYRCHGPDPAERKGGSDGLRFDTEEGIFADLGGHAAVVRGKPESSELIARVTSTDPDHAMPPKGAGKPLTPHEIELISKWIKQGAKFSQHWSYVKPVRPAIPAVKKVDWVRNDIDRFILSRLEREGLHPVDEADRYALARRVSLDLTGLPPTIEETDQFVNETGPHAYEALVDRMLAKQAFGEHWGLLWLDLARYADSSGYADDPARKIWLYRDYVIKSFNANKPFDRFTIEQIAGDLLPDPTDEQLIATAFHRNTMTNNEGGTNDEEFRNVAVVDRVNTTMAVWMGTTIACAQCHTHKYDPITQEEYFRFFAFFNSTEDADRGDETPLHSIYTDEQQQQRTDWQSQLAKLDQTLKTETPELMSAQEKWDLAFPRSIVWVPLTPQSVKALSGMEMTVGDDASVKVAPGAKNDTYTIDLSDSPGERLAVRLDHDRLERLNIKMEDVTAAFRRRGIPVLAERSGRTQESSSPNFQIPVNSPGVTSIEQLNDIVISTTDGGQEIPFRVLGLIEHLKVPLRAIRVEALTDDTLPEKGPGHSGGNFVITRVSATINPPSGSTTSGRFVRIELPGEKLLSLAEVQIFSGAENIAVKGNARQVSTDFGGDAKRAIDGNTNGAYFEAMSTTHTAAGKDPWWEVDLLSEQKIDRIAVWNRRDGVESRLSNFRIAVLNDKREPVWQKEVADFPNPNVEYSINGQKRITFDAAVADFSQAGFDPMNVLLNSDPKTKGWAVGGAIGQPHALSLISKQAIEVPIGSNVTLTIEQSSDFANHTLGRFRLSATDESNVEEWARTPETVFAALLIPVTERTKEQKDAVTQHFLKIAPDLETARQQRAAVQKMVADLKPETVPVMKEMTANRRVTKLQHRGNFSDLGQEVTEGVPVAFGSIPDSSPRNRLAVARWLVDDSNPLTARVIANRYWEQLFGIGIVASSEDFGSQGDLPWHPELLDWLACELSGQPGATAGGNPPEVSHRWDTKQFLKKIVMSATYRQSSKVTPELQQMDPDNRLVARGPRFRLSAETLRDQALLIGGLLSSKLYGPPVKPLQPNLGLSAAFGSSTDWQTSAGEDRYRRGVYTTWRRSNPYPSMATFDAPNREVCTVRRVRTNTPLQALVTLNDPVNVEAAQALARRLLKNGGTTIADRVRYGFRLALSRPPYEKEQRRLTELYERSLARFSQNADDAKRMATDPLGPVENEADIAELAAWTVVGNVLLNLDETVMKR